LPCFIEHRLLHLRSGQMIPVETAYTGQLDVDDVPFATLRRPWGTTRMQLIHVSLVTNTFVNIIEWKAGTQLPRHHHAGTVHAYTFWGRWRYLEYDWVAGPNSYVFEPPGTNHTLRVEEDMKGLFVTQGAFIYFDEEGRISSYSDAGVMLEECSRALAAEGLKLPDSVLR
jgi:quercetin dioxygenase-like cupin family protein